MNEPVILPVGPIEANCYLIPDGAGACAVVDPGDEFETIEAALRERGWKPAAVLLTHGHFDHIGAAKQLRAACGCPIVIGEEDAALLADPQRSLAEDDRQGRYRFSADRTVKEGDEIAAGALRFSVLDTPGHTKGGVCYRCGAALFCGDTLFRGDCGRTDLPGGSWPVLQASLQKLRKLAEEPENLAVYPGHGPASDIKTEAATNFTMRESNADDYD